jgi:hypothetical protein
MHQEDSDVVAELTKTSILDVQLTIRSSMSYPSLVLCILRLMNTKKNWGGALEIEPRAIDEFWLPFVPSLDQHERE